MNTGNYEFIRSYSRPGESQVIFVARDSLHSNDMPGALVPGAQEGRRHPADPARRRGRAVLQRRVRRHLRQHLRADRRGLRLRGAEGLRRAHRAGTAARARRRQGRTGRPAGREDLDRAVQHQARHARHSAAARCSRRWTSRTRWRPPASSRPPATACSCASAARSIRSRRSATSRSAPATAPSASATSPTCIAASPIRPRRACASWARTRSASRWR